MQPQPRIAVLTASVALASAAFVATPPQTTASVVAVTIDASVVDGSGRAIAGLASTEFTVELDGQPRRVVAVTYHPAGAPMAGAIGPVFDAVAGAPPVYRLVVQPPDATPPGTEFSVAVAVSRKGAKVQAPARAAAAPVAVTGTRTAPPTGTPKSPEERLRAAIATGAVERGVPLKIGRAVRRSADPAKLTLEVQIEIAASAAAPLTGLLGLVDSRGAVRSANPQIEAAPDRSHRVDLSLPLDPGAYALRFAVADAAGAIGTIESSVNARLTTMGSLLASDLLRWTSDANGRKPFLLEEIPTALTAIGATIELYSTNGATPPPDLLVKMELGSVERVVTPESRDGILVADAEFPLERLGSGSHTLRATVASTAGALGSVSVTLVKR